MKRGLLYASSDAEIYSRLPSLALRGQWELRGSVQVEVTTSRNISIPLDTSTSPMQGRLSTSP